MKTFSTSGTGNQQTLSEIETNKIPVYDSLQDVEADLANIPEGQLALTKDTGDELAQPVNVVESGNLHAVSSNAVAKSLSYSTTEQKTGGVWKDGKPIYRIVTTATKNQQVDTTEYKDTGALLPSNVDKYILIRSTQNTANAFYYSTTNTTLYIAAVTKMDALAGTDYILEYTKTTD